jgi:predicted cupin superfamily sugar epimerase
LHSSFLHDDPAQQDVTTDDREFQRMRALFGLRPQESGEGTFIRQNLKDDYGTAIVALLGGKHYSALHRLDATEVSHFYAGAPRRMLLLFPDGRIEEPVLGRDYEAGHQPQVVVPKGVWQGSRSDGPWSLTGATMAPGFRPDGFEFPDVEALVRRYPAAEARIRDLAPNEEGRAMHAARAKSAPGTAS